MLNAVVIPFPKRAAGDLPANLNVNGPAQVIIFPGVRYMRLPEETEDLFEIATAPRKAPSKRK
ncbi:hypothetical protein [Taklimakanibacter lacteus]|uniref:hypothetical protein n=1 Tax=Taklimakanibacter lacteus TaxID=2268456 RepID=UPI000E66340D